jgi:peptide/nickel transport system substrate-binding protein
MKAAARLLAADAAADWLFLLPNLVVVKAGLTGVAANATSLSFDVTTIAGKG